MKLTIVALIKIFSIQYNIDPFLVEAIVQQESMYNPNSTGGLNEVGLMQMRPEYLDNPQSYYDPRKNLREGIKRLSKLKRLEPKLGKNWFCAWNLGANGALRLHQKNKLNNFKYCKEVRAKYSKLLQYNRYRTSTKETYVSI